MKKGFGNTKDPTDWKLGPNWEGPYKITKLAGKGACYFEGKQIPRP